VYGVYEGVARTASHGDVPVSLELRVEQGRIVGVMHTPLGDFFISRGSLEGERLTLTLDSYDDEATLTASLSGGLLKSEFVGFGERARLELKRTGPVGPIIRPRIKLSKDEWREDLRYLARELPLKHKNAFHRITRAQFEREVSALDARLPSLSDDRIVMEMSRIVAMIGDGHTSLGWGSLFPRVPLGLFWFGGELRVTETTVRERRLLGAKVLKIGGVPIAEVYRREQPYIQQAETEGFVRNWSARYLLYPAHLKTLGLSREATHAAYTFEDERGSRFTLNIRAAESADDAQWLDAARSKPLSAMRAERPLWYEYLKDSQTLYFNFAGYPRRREFEAFSREFFDFIDSHDVKRLVIDMRRNGGGDFNRGREFIVGKLKQRPRFGERGRLYVITGRATFSAGMVNALDFRNELHAILVGEPTGQRPNSYSENRGFSLPNSHLDLSYSTEFYKLQPTDTPGVIPDQLIEPDWSSYRAGRDRALEWILAGQSR
jgi:hypothetical protein